MTARRYTCEWCGTPFEAMRQNARYCGGAHRVAASRARRDRDALSALDAARDAVSELLAHTGSSLPSTNHTAFVRPHPELTAVVESAFADAKGAILRRP
jgi:hypothetical protein